MNTIDNPQIELTLVVPILNEKEQLPVFLENIKQQEQVNFELLIVDGGSTDGTLEWLSENSKCSVIHSERPGRGRQLNLGGTQAAAPLILFLHVDSLFFDLLALRKALDYIKGTTSENVAGHFALTFRRTERNRSLAYYFYEWKARLGRAETIHGDQGFLLSRTMFNQLDGFSEELAVMEDTDFAERLRNFGQWQLLPVEISTSARRFEVEGLWQRQLLGALIMCFREIGWHQYFAAAKGVYRQQGDVDKLRVQPYFKLVRTLHKKNGFRSAMKIWWKSGCYVRRHAWQLTFALDARREFYKQRPYEDGRAFLTNMFEPVYNFLTDNYIGKFLATVLLIAWFEATDFWLKYKERKNHG